MGLRFLSIFVLITPFVTKGCSLILLEIIHRADSENKIPKTC